MRKILLATDLSKRSDRALQRAIQLGRDFTAEVCILHVIDEELPVTLIETEKQHASLLLEEMVRAAAGPAGPQVRLLVEVGDVLKTILRVAETNAVDLVVMGAHRRRPLQDAFVGTTVERVMRLGGWPVLMVNRPATHPYRYVLAAVDLSESSAHALSVTARLGLLRDADLKVLHVYRVPAKGMLTYAGVTDESIHEHVALSAREAMERLTRFVEGVGLEGPRIGKAVEEGEAVEGIRRVVERERPDLLVAGTRGHTGLRKVLLGSVASRLLREVDCDVLAVPPEKAESQPQA